MWHLMLSQRTNKTTKVTNKLPIHSGINAIHMYPT